jgi:NAD(P)-dependent dehydrogenase (short-subunit alcohol dehydrogenase family)
MKRPSFNSLKDKHCFITGAASGIGRATALAAAREGAVLFLTDINAAALAQVAAEVGEAGGRVASFKALDISDYEAVRAYAAELRAAHGSMDLVMNVAGIAIWGSIGRLRHEQWRRCVEVNLMGPIHVMECLVPDMVRAGRGGHLVNVSSAAGLIGLPWHAAYSASKFGLRGISEVLRFDLRRHGIGLSLVCPGGVNTGLVETVEIEGVDRAAPAVVAIRKHFVRRAITPERAARAILKGIKANRYLVFTSADIWWAHWLQRWCPPLYALLMQKINDHLQPLGDSITGELSARKS